MGTRPKFTFDTPQEIYDMKYAEVVREIEAGLLKWRHQVIEAFENEFPDEDAQMLWNWLLLESWGRNAATR